MPALVQTVNVGSAERNPHKPSSKLTGIGKRPTDEPVEVRAPGPRTGGLGSGLVGDYIGDARHHGGDRQAVYAFQREDLDDWAATLGHELPNGSFGENLTIRGLDINAARVGERWRVGTAPDAVELEVTDPRVPCATFAGWLAEKGWVKRFTAAARPGTYLSVVRPGRIRSGDPVEVVFTPEHDVTVGLVFRATTTQRELLPRLLAARDYLEPSTLAMAEKGETLTLDDA